MASEADILENIARRVRERLQGEGLRSWPVSLQRQAMDLAGMPVSTRRMVDVWREDREEKNCMSDEAHDAFCRAVQKRREAVEAGAKMIERDMHREAVNLFRGAELSRQRTREDVRRLVERLRR